MPTYGVVSIDPSPSASERRLPQVYKGVGLNTGNLLFTNAVWSQLGGEKEHVGFAFDPGALNERLDALIIPAANWINATVDMGFLADLIEKLTIPVVVIGLGAHDGGEGDDIRIPEGTIRFLRAAADRSASVSVRGELTRQVLERLGVANAVVTGCPSLYHEFRHATAARDEPFSLHRCLIHATRFYAEPAFARAWSSDRQLFRFAYHNRIDILYQSEYEEMAILLEKTADADLDESVLSRLKLIYFADDWDDLTSYIWKHGRVFLNVDEWAREVSRYAFTFGTRLHGTIMALNSGAPALLMHHDARTREICDFARIPSVDADEFYLTPATVEKLYEGLDLDAYYRAREENKPVYKGFLAANGVEAVEF